MHVWLRRSAELAAARYALDEQISLLERAVEFEPDPAGCARLRREIAHAHALNFDDEAFVKAMVSTIDACSDDAELGQLYAEAAFHCAVRWQQEADRERIDDWSRLALELGAGESPVRVRALVARAICRPEEADALGRKKVAAKVALSDSRPARRSGASVVCAPYPRGRRARGRRLRRGLPHRRAATGDARPDRRPRPPRRRLLGRPTRVPGGRSIRRRASHREPP